MAPRWFQDGSKMVSVFAGGGGATGPLAILGPSWISVICSKKNAIIINFYSIFETDPAFRLDENAARALKCVRGRKNERGLPRFTPTSPAFFFFLSRQDPLSASTVWGISFRRLQQDKHCSAGHELVFAHTSFLIKNFFRH